MWRRFAQRAVGEWSEMPPAAAVLRAPRREIGALWGVLRPWAGVARVIGQAISAGLAAVLVSRSLPRSR